MKQYKYLYAKMLDKDLIKKAYKKLRKGKTKRREIIYIDEHLDSEIDKMYEMILNTKPEGFNIDPSKAYKAHKRTPKIINEHGKERKIYMPEIHEQWLHHIIVLVLEPIIINASYRYSCGSFPSRGAHYGKRKIEKWIKEGKDIKYFAKLDIRHFYDSIRVDVLMRELSLTIKDDLFLYVVEKSLEGFKKGIPLGFYISQWLANFLLTPLDWFIVKTLGFKKTARYMDDIVIFAGAKKCLHEVIVEIKKFIGRRFRLKVKNNYQVIRFYYKGKKTVGRPLDYMGFVFYREKTIIRKSIMLKAVSLAKGLKKAKDKNRGYFLTNVKAMISYAGWFSCTDTYGCYFKYIKPHVDLGKLRKIVSKIDRRLRYETVERGTLYFRASRA